ncbi:AMP-binding protein [Nonomuraea aridisoli]|nr:AMP-binding protein [Nonomuraea aridisoli]
MDERIVMVDSVTGLTLTEEQLDERSATATVQLRRRGVRDGDGVLVCLPAGPDLLVAFVAVTAAGGVIWSLPADLDAGTLRELVRGSRARVMISNVGPAVDAADESRVRVVVGVDDLCAPRPYPV